mgnify:CR=1 FL=1
MAELADALDLGSSVHDVQVQVLLSAFAETLPVAGSVFFDTKYAREVAGCQSARKELPVVDSGRWQVHCIAK